MRAVKKQTPYHILTGISILNPQPSFRMRAKVSARSPHPIKSEKMHSSVDLPIQRAIRRASLAV